MGHQSGGVSRRPPQFTLRNHISLGHVFGIRIWLSRMVLWFIGAIALFESLEDPRSFVPTVLLISAVLGIVLLHELGHCVVAKHYGVTVSHITLWPLGGVAWMEDIPEDPKIEGLIALAGPAVNFALALLALPAVFLLPGDPGSMEMSPAGMAATFIGINLTLGIFNLVPAFPMDGGRVLRAVMGTRMDWLTATEKAVRIGKTLAIIGGLAGIFTGHFMLTFVAGYIWLMGTRELFAMRARKLGGSFPFGAFAKAAQGAQGSQSPFGFPSQESTSPEEDQGPDAMGADASRVQRSSSSASDGFSDDQIEQLENFRGPLKRDWKDSE
ncbi:MAG: Zn-dependent protease [Candidatus Paceibacteria bacterium]|jgi:Zn-dependent protease